MTYASVIAADAPLAWWRLDETSGTSAADSGSGTAANGTYNGSYTLAEPGIDGADAGGGTSVLFADGSGDYVDVGAMPAKLQLAVGAAFSLEAWVAMGSDLSSNGPAIITEAFAGDGTVRWMLGTFNGSSPTATPSFGWYNGAWRLVQASSAINDDLWHHLVGTFDGTQQRLYVDGSLVAGPTTPGGTQPGGNENLYIGRRWDSAASWLGFIDEVAIYSSALSSTQVSNHYAAFNPSPTALRATQAIAQAVQTDATPELRATQALVQAVQTDTSPELRVSQIVVQMVAERDYAGWGLLMVDDDTFQEDGYLA